MEKLRDEVISNIRAVLISVKGKVSLRQLERDYHTIVGDKIPYSQLGCKNLEEFVRSINTLSLTKDPNGDVFVDAKASEKTNHITAMVSMQKSAKKKPPPRPPRYQTYHGPRRPIPISHWRPNNVSGRFQMARTSQRSVPHNQFVNRGPVHIMPTVMSRVTIPAHSAYAPRPNYGAVRPMPHHGPHNGAVRSVQAFHHPPVSYQHQMQQNQHGQNQNSVRNNNNAQFNAKNENSAISQRVVTNSFLNNKEVLRESNKLTNGKTSPTLSNGVRKIKLTSNIVQNNNIPQHAELSKDILNGAKKRVSRNMSQSSFERDSGNSSPVSESGPESPSSEIIYTDNPIVDLKNFVNHYKLGELDIIRSEIKPKRKYEKYTFQCTIKVGEYTYLSYPKDFYEPKLAEEYCATIALKELIPKYTKRKELLLSNQLDIKQRILPMLRKHTDAIWSWQIEQDYVEKFKEQLPQNWLEVIDTCENIAVEKMSEQDKFFLRFCQPGEKAKGINPIFHVSDVSVPANTVQFGENGKLQAQVTCVMSLNEIWCRQYDTPEFEEYTEMLGRLENFYQTNKDNLKVNKLEERSYYVAFYDGIWYRIRVLEIQENLANCFLIDFGHEYEITINNIYKLRREFATSQAQAFVCRLAGLEDLYESSMNSQIVQNLVGAEFVLESADETINPDTPNEESLPVLMYDINDGHCMNEELISLLTMESALPVLNKTTITEVFVSNIEDNGDIYVQLHSLGYDSMITMLETVDTELIKNPPIDKLEKITSENSKNRLYLAKYKDGHWYRVKIIDWSPKGDRAQIYYVDWGHTDVVKVSDEVLYPIDKLNDVLSKFPPQALRLRIALDKIPENFVDLAKKLMPEETPVLLKSIGTLNDIDVVEFYKRHEDGSLFCINKSISLEAELKNEDSNNNIRGTRKKLVQLAQLKGEDSKKVPPSGGTLKRPTLPEKGSYFEVSIPFAVSPYNFFVQPFSSKNELDALMDNLQLRYEKNRFSPLRIEDIVPGKIYASKHSDGIWYRTNVLKVIHSGSISVFYVDVGYYGNLTLNQLVPLDPEFTHLPYQALKAKLADIIPKKNKWSVEDCDYFKELVERKSYVSVLMEVEKDELYESDIVLKLVLIDTSQKNDIYITKLLIEKDIAKATN